MTRCNLHDEDPSIGDGLIELDRETYFNSETCEILSLDYSEYGCGVYAHIVTWDEVQSWNLAQYFDYAEDFIQFLEDVAERERERAAENLEAIRRREEFLARQREAA